MKRSRVGRREFVRGIAGSAAAIAALPSSGFGTPLPRQTAPKIKFSVVGINHGHINSQVEAVIRGGGELVSMFAKEPDLTAAFVKRFPQVKVARTEAEVLEDKSIQLVVSAAIPDERAPLGIRAMKHGKDFMVDKPGITTLEQLAEARKVQAETRRIYSIMYSERLENRATVKAGELVQCRGDRSCPADHRSRAPSDERQDTAGVVLRARALRRHPLRHCLASGRSVPLLHRLDQRRRGRIAGRESQSPAVSRSRRLRRHDAPRQSRHRICAGGLVHAERALDVG